MSKKNLGHFRIGNVKKRKQKPLPILLSRGLGEKTSCWNYFNNIIFLVSTKEPD
jgi:hypothetical protein